MKNSTLVVSGLMLVASFALHGHGCSHAGDVVELSDPAWIPLLVCGFPVAKEAIDALIGERRIRAALLISVAMIACVAIGQLFAAGEVAFIMALGERLEDWTVNRAKKGLRKLVDLVPQVAHKIMPRRDVAPVALVTHEHALTDVRVSHAHYGIEDMPVEKIAVGDLIEIRPGETVPVDGAVTEGATSIDQSTMTGESVPVEKAIGDEVYSGTINRFGKIVIRVTKVGSDSSLQKLIRMVRAAEAKKAPMQRTADKWAAILVPCSMTIAILTFLGVWGLTGDIHEALIRGVTILVVFCPCALALATPTSVMAAIGQATKHGVIVKSGEALERMGAVTVACFDKTGTLQNGTTLRAGAAQTIAELRASGVRSLMLTGDHEPIARKFAAEAGVDDVRFELKPDDKSRIVEEEQAKGASVMMVGDGVNDAIALKLADVGIAMGGIGATDIAQEYADVALVTDDLTAIPYLKRLSVACVRLIKLNITISMTINACAIVCSILGILGPVSGALVHNLGSILVVLNAALLYDRKFRFSSPKRACGDYGHRIKTTLSPLTRMIASF